MMGTYYIIIKEMFVFEKLIYIGHVECYVTKIRTCLASHQGIFYFTTAPNNSTVC